jgi:hypothetical protein
MVPDIVNSDRRKHERVSVELPLAYRIGKKTLLGSTVNVCHEGILVESYLSSRTALDVFKVMKKMQNLRLDVEFTYEGKRDLRDVEIKHFHLDYSGCEAYRFTVGFWLPRIEQG